MKTTLRTKLLQHFAKKKHNNEGFTLIELLVVIIIIGILAAIALPSFLNQASKAKESEAKTYAGSYNSAQQAYRLENPTFADKFDDLNLGLDFANSDSYTYTAGGGTATNADISATPKDSALKGVRGCVEATTTGTTSSKLLVSDAVDTVPACTE